MHTDGQLIPEVIEGSANMGQINFNGVDRNINVINIKPINNHGIKINYTKDNEAEDKQLNNEIIDIDNNFN